MKRIKIHEEDRFYIILVLIMLLVSGLFWTAEASGQTIRARIELTDSTKSTDVCVGTIDVVKNGKTTTFKLYRGKRGGYYYLTGEVDKNGRPKRRYLSKKEREINNLK